MKIDSILKRMSKTISKTKCFKSVINYCFQHEKSTDTQKKPIKKSICTKFCKHRRNEHGSANMPVALSYYDNHSDNFQCKHILLAVYA